MSGFGGNNNNKKSKDWNGFQNAIYDIYSVLQCLVGKHESYDFLGLVKDIILETRKCFLKF